jgi:hypothetical protein
VKASWFSEESMKEIFDNDKNEGDFFNGSNQYNKNEEIEKELYYEYKYAFHVSPLNLQRREVILRSIIAKGF